MPPKVVPVVILSDEIRQRIRDNTILTLNPEYYDPKTMLILGYLSHNIIGNPSPPHALVRVHIDVDGFEVLRLIPIFDMINWIEDFGDAPKIFMD